MIRLIQLEEIQPYHDLFTAEGLSLVKGTKYYGYFEGGRLLGFTGLLARGTKTVFKNHWTLPACRRRGIYRQLFDFSLRMAKMAGSKQIESQVRPPALPLYLAAGFSVVKRYKHTTLVRLDLP